MAEDRFIAFSPNKDKWQRWLPPECIYENPAELSKVIDVVTEIYRRHTKNAPRTWLLLDAALKVNIPYLKERGSRIKMEVLEISDPAMDLRALSDRIKKYTAGFGGFTNFKGSR